MSAASASSSTSAPATGGGGGGGGGEAAGKHSSVIVHPLVLLSVTDHYYRVAKDTKDKRVVGVILGESFQGRIDVTNSFAVPYEEDPKDPRVFYLDHDYLEQYETGCAVSLKWLRPRAIPLPPLPPFAACTPCTRRSPPRRR